MDFGYILPASGLDLIILAAAMAGRAASVIMAILCTHSLILNTIRKDYGPLNTRYLNLGWMCIAFAAFSGGIIFIWQGAVTFGLQDSLISRLGVVAVWSGLSLGLTFRAAGFAPRPHFLFMSASTLWWAAFILVMAVGEW